MALSSAAAAGACATWVIVIGGDLGVAGHREQGQTGGARGCCEVKGGHLEVLAKDRVPNLASRREASSIRWHRAECRKVGESTATSLQPTASPTLRLHPQVVHRASHLHHDLPHAPPRFHESIRLESMRLPHVLEGEGRLPAVAQTRETRATSAWPGPGSRAPARGPPAAPLPPSGPAGTPHNTCRCWPRRSPSPHRCARAAISSTLLRQMLGSSPWLAASARSRLTRPGPALYAASASSV